MREAFDYNITDDCVNDGHEIYYNDDENVVKVMYNKLAYRDHECNIMTDMEPMTMAQYHSMIHQ